jgi:hypothetical protein
MQHGYRTDHGGFQWDRFKLANIHPLGRFTAWSQGFGIVDISEIQQLDE